MIRPTLWSAALAGVVTALAWPPLWSRYGGQGSGGSMELVVATLLVIALPAHAFVVGFKRDPAADGRTVDTGLLRRIAAWLLAAAATTGVMAMLPA